MTLWVPAGADRIEDGLWVDVRGDPTCWACSGEECWLCVDPSREHPCEHDVHDRHNGERCRDIPREEHDEHQ